MQVKEVGQALEFSQPLWNPPKPVVAEIKHAQPPQAADPLGNLLEAVVGEHHHTIAGLHSELLQRSRKSRSGGADFAIGITPRAGHQRDLVRHAGDRGLEKMMEKH